MADLTRYFGGQAFIPANVTPLVPPDPPETQAREAMLDAGLIPPETVHLDGKLHRFSTNPRKRSDKTAWYIFFPDGIPAGRFGDWKTGLDVPWRAQAGRELTDADHTAYTRRIAEAKKARDEELERTRAIAKEMVEGIWASCPGADETHPYLARKGVRAHGLRIAPDGRLLAPIYAMDGELCSLQYITHDGEKRYHPGGAVGGRFWAVGVFDDPGTVYIAEGFATAATVHEVTGRPCVVAYSASNLVPVAGIWREKLGGTADIVIVADNDASAVGQRYAEQAAAKHGARVVMPPEPGDANDYRAAGHDLAALLVPAREAWLIPADDFASNPAPISWLVKRWWQADALIMVHGPSGGGKTFAVLDWALRMAAGVDDWNGCKVRPGPVVYLAGEGHHGLRGRVAAWKQHHGAKSLRMWLSKAGCDLDTPEGYQRVALAIRELPERPGVIIVDTLHRFLSGDENSSQDARRMLDACARLMGEFGCSVVLVHHTGVNEEAQHRARGSSAWRGALDIEISVVPGKDGGPLQIVQRKSKDAELAEPVHAQLVSVQIDGWFDEDGQPVTSAVLVQAVEIDAPKVKRDSRIDKHRKAFENAWWASGAEEREGLPYVSRSALREYLMTNMGMKEANASQHTKPSAEPGKMVRDLLDAEHIIAHENGWRTMPSIDADSMLLRKRTG
jgi:phage/plasmid primase-like uncharacterized protein